VAGQVLARSQALLLRRGHLHESGAGFRLVGRLVKNAYARLNQYGYSPVYLDAGSAIGEQSENSRSWTHVICQRHGTTCGWF
jgi:hypothetical protein